MDVVALGTNRKKLRRFQRRVVSWGKSMRHPAYFHDMRLGKTVCTIATYEAWQRVDPLPRVLVVAPLSTLPGWQQELHDHGYQSTIVRTSDWRTLSRHSMEHHAGWLLTNYEAVRRNPWVATMPWDVVVLDESTRIKNPKAGITKVCTRAFRAVKHRMILCGLPAPESEMEYFEQFHFLRGGFMGYSNFWQWRARLFEQRGYAWIPRDGTVEKIRAAVHANAYVLSRKQAGMANRAVLERRYIDQSPVQHRLHREVLKRWAVGEFTTKWRVVLQQWLGCIAGGFHPETGECVAQGKTNELIALVCGELRREQVVVFFRYNRELAHVCRTLRDHGVSVTWLKGSVPLDKRAARMRLFQRGERRVMLCQVKVASHGLDLSTASATIFYSNPHGLEERNQCMERTNHLLKKDDRLYIDLVTRDSVDVDISDALVIKNADAKFFMSTVFNNWRQRVGID